MGNRFRRLPSPAMAVAFVALLAALTGTAVALPGKNSVKKDDIAKGAVNTTDIANNTIRTSDIRNATIRGIDVRNDSLTGDDIVESSLSKVPSASSADNATTANSAPPSGPAGGDLTGNYPNPLVGNDTINSAKIAADAVGASEIAANAVGASEIAANVVRASELGTITQRSATSASIPAGGNGSVTANCLAGEQVLSGGNDGFFDVFVVASRQSGNGWAVFGHNDAAAARTITAHVYCLAP